MNNEYDPIQLVEDATIFSTTKFGAHYLERLEMLKEVELKKSMNRQLSEHERSDAGTAANIYDGELSYFRTAKTVNNDPKLIDKMREGIKARIRKQKPKE